MSEDQIGILARAAGEWLTFERLRQELLAVGAEDPLLISAADRNVGAAVHALLDRERPARDVELVHYALRRALSSHPDIIKLRIGVTELDVDASLKPSSLQALLQARDDVFARWSEFQQGMQRVGATVCQLSIDGHASGTGFLISDRHVLTAHHCIRPLLDANGDPLAGSAARLEAVFDDIALPGASSSASRMSFAAAADWLVFSSKHDDVEDTSTEPPDYVQPGSLDFAIICLREAAGLTAPRQQKSAPRHWIDVHQLAPQPGPQAQMLIAHYPGGADLRLSVGLFDRHSSCQQRIRYRTPAIVGSSGAPCFTVDWKPYALHNAGYAAVHINQGVPLSLIVDRIGGVEALTAAQSGERALLPAITADGSPVFGRTELAAEVRAILSGESEVVTMLVTSKPRGGKSFTADLVRSMVIDAGHSAFLLDAEKFAADSPETFARRLVHEVAGAADITPQPASPDSRQRARWISHSLSEWTRARVSNTNTDKVAGNAPESVQSLWVILDRCDTAQFPAETHDLLVAMITDPDLNARQPLRFLLFGYDGDLGTVLSSRVWRSTLDLLSVGGVLPYMRYVLSSLGVDEPVADTRAAAADWIGAAAHFGITELPMVAHALTRWAAQRRERLATNAGKGTDS